MTAETGDYIDNLDPNSPPDTDPIGYSFQHLRLLKRVLDMTFVGDAGNSDIWDENNGALLVGPTQLNRQPADIAAIASEIGLDLDDVAAESTIDDLVANALRRDQAETIAEDWAISSLFAFSGVRPTVGGVGVALTTELPDQQATLRLPSDTQAANYTFQSDDYLIKKLRYNGAGGHIFDLENSQVGDIAYITNASSSASGVLTVRKVGHVFRNRYGETLADSFTITGRYKTVGVHRAQTTAWELVGDYD